MMDDHPLLTSNGGASIMDQARTHNFPGALLGLQGKKKNIHTYGKNNRVYSTALPE